MVWSPHGVNHCLQEEISTAHLNQGPRLLKAKLDMNVFLGMVTARLTRIPASKQDEVDTRLIQAQTQGTGCPINTLHNTDCVLPDLPDLISHHPCIIADTQFGIETVDRCV